MLIRSGRNAHCYIQFINNRIVLFETHKDDPHSLIWGLGKALFMGLALFGLIVGVWVQAPASAELPTGYSTASGSATFQNDGTTLNIHASNKAIINYSTFNIGAKNTVNIFSPLSLHRVAAGNPSQILGSLNASGKVFLVNPSGIFFGAGSQVNVQGLVASTLDIKNEDFLAGNYVFQRSANQAPAAIVNQGNIQATESIAMLSGAVENAGSITAPQVHIAVGDRMTYHVGPELAIDVTVNESLKQKVEDYQSAIRNSGTISAEYMKLQARLAQSFYATTVNNSGILKATGFAQNASGSIVAVGQTDDHNAVVQNTGTITANGSAEQAQGGVIHLEGDTTTNSGNLLAMGTEGGQGGSVSMLGDKILNGSGSRIDVSGGTGGGTVLVGGDYLGQNPLVRNAQFNYLDALAQITANALTQGNGGKVILWSDQKTMFQGRIEAKGGSQGGHGGFVETSSKQVLQATGEVNASAANGQAGQWLLDPNNITIQNVGVETNVANSGGDPDVFSSTNDSAIVTTGTINNALNNGTSVTIQTTTAGANTEGGDITVAAGTVIDKTAGGDATLNLKAHRSILFNGVSGNEISIGSTSNKLNVILNADTDQGSDAGVGGAIRMSYTDITSNGGDITLGGGADPLNTMALGTTSDSRGIVLVSSILDSASGTISLRGQARDIGANSTLQGVNLSLGSQLKTTDGDIQVTGTGGAGVSSNHGLIIEDADSKITTVDGDINLTGNGGNASGHANHGIFLYNGGQVTSTGTGTITLSGTGGDGVDANNGIRIEGTNSLITSLNGNIDITGQGGQGTGDSNHGLLVYNAGQVTSTGSATIQVTGTGGNGDDDNTGIRIEGTNSRITSHSGNITLAGQGNGVSTNNRGIYLNSGGQVTSTGTATLDLSGTGGAGIGNNFGIGLNGSNSLISSVDGNISITTQGGHGSGDSNVGLHLNNGGQIISTGNATLDLSGTGGNGVTSNYGIQLSGTNARITSATGDITLTGTGGLGSGNSNHGIFLYNGGQVTSTGTAKLTLSGTSNGPNNSDGIRVEAANALITSLNGDINLTGQGQGTAHNNRGIHIYNGGQITSTGTATINLTGTGGNGTSGNHGIYFFNANSRVSSQNGNITLTGQGGHGSTSENIGIYINNGGQIISTGNATLNLSGTGGNGTSTNHGVQLAGTNSKITSATGNVTVTGVGGNGSVNSNYGVFLYNGGQITSTGTATLTISGTGGKAAAGNDGVRVEAANALISSVDGNVTVTGAGGQATSNINRGIHIYNGGQITSTGTATLTISGTGGTGTSNNQGIYFNGANSLISSVNGNVSVTGMGGSGTGGGHHGIHFQNGGQIDSTGGANLFITALKGTNASNSLISDAGSNLLGNNTMTGNLTLVSNDYSLTNLQIRTGGELAFRPYAASDSLGLNGGAGTFQLDNSVLGRIDTSVVSPAKVIVGHASAGTGTVTIGTGWNISTYDFPLEIYGGSISTGSISMGSNSLLLRALTGDITLQSGATLSSNAAGDALILATDQDFLNLSGSSALDTPNGRWLVYSSHPDTTTEGGLTYTKRYNRTFDNDPPASIAESGNLMMYSVAPVLTVTADNQTKVSGTLNPTFTGVISGFIDGDTDADAFTGEPLYSTTAVNGSPGGNYAITAGPGTLVSDLGYQFNYVPGILTVTALPSSGLSLSSASIPYLLNPVQNPVNTMYLPYQLQEESDQKMPTPLVSAENGLTPIALNTDIKPPIVRLSRQQNTITLIDPKTRLTRAEIPVGDRPVSVVVSPSGNKVFVANYGDSSLSIIDMQQGQVIQTIPLEVKPTKVRLSRNKQKLLIYSHSRTPQLQLDMATLQTGLP